MSSENPLQLSKAFIPYPTSTLSPKIVPNDLTSFKTRGLSSVERDLNQRLKELHEDYVRAVEHFNWNKLVYEAEINFEPIIGETYHLYEMRGKKILSMIDPAEWSQKHIASFRLNIDRQFEMTETGQNIDRRALFGFSDRAEAGDQREVV